MLFVHSVCKLPVQAVHELALPPVRDGSLVKLKQAVEHDMYIFIVIKASYVASDGIIIIRVARLYPYDMQENTKHPE